MPLQGVTLQRNPADPETAVSPAKSRFHGSCFTCTRPPQPAAREGEQGVTGGRDDRAVRAHLYWVARDPSPPSSSPAQQTLPPPENDSAPLPSGDRTMREREGGLGWSCLPGTSWEHTRAAATAGHCLRSTGRRFPPSPAVPQRQARAGAAARRSSCPQGRSAPARGLGGRREDGARGTCLPECP